MFIKKYINITLALVCLFLAPTVLAEDKLRWISLSLDNDLFTGSDDGYTNGIFFSSYELNSAPLTSEQQLPWYFRIQNRLVKTESANLWVKIHNFSQVMVTPTDIESVPPNQDDLPYAGFLYWQGGIAAIREKSTTYVSMLIGAAGPVALAEQSQKTVHRIIDSTIPRGWDFQLNNELLLGLSGSYFEQKLYRPHGKIETDLVIGGNGSLGNYRSGIGAAAFFRFGKQLSKTHGVFALLTGREVNPVAQEGWFGYFGTAAYYELNNMVFQGNSSSSNSSLQWDKQVGGVTAGFAYTKKRWGFSFGVSDMGSLGSRYYGRQRFGSLSILYRMSRR